MSVFSRYARYYDLLYRDKDYASEARFVHSLIRRFAPGASSLLELGCGTGVHAQHLAALGYELHGVDSSPGMLDQAKARLAGRDAEETSRLSFSLGDIREIRLDRSFDAVISLFHAMSYQVANEDLRAACSTARIHLSPGGIFLFDCWYGPAVLTEKPSARIKRLEDESISVTRFAEPAMRSSRNVVDVHYRIFIREKATGKVEEIEETHRMRYLFKPEVENLLSGCGFSLIECGEWMTGKEIGSGTWNVYFAAKARESS
jgi:SAM-dependent methyltransferase